MNLRRRIAIFNLLHLPLLLLVNFLWILWRVYVTKDVYPDIFAQDLFTQISTVVVQTFYTMVFGLPTAVGLLIIIQIIDLTAYTLIYRNTGDTILSLRRSGVITSAVILVVYAWLGFVVFDVPFLFWVGFSLYLLAEWFKYRRFSAVEMRQPERQESVR